MAGEQLDDSSVIDGGGSDMPSPESYIEFLDKMCAYYMVFGMSYDEYWNKDVCMAKYYYDAHVIREEVLAEKENQSAWLQGVYTLQALNVAVEVIMKSLSGKKGSKKIKAEYPSKPIELAPRENKTKPRELTYEERAAMEVAQWTQLLFSK